jgi:hypothetical protein
MLSVNQAPILLDQIQSTCYLVMGAEINNKMKNMATGIKSRWPFLVMQDLQEN